MKPTLMIQDAIFVKEVPKEEIKVNDIISFSENGEIITHRIIDIITEDGQTKYKTKGDNNNSADRQLTTYENIEGKYQFKISGFGVITEILKNKITLIILIIIVIMMSLYQKEVEKKKQLRKEKRKQYESNQKDIE